MRIFLLTFLTVCVFRVSAADLFEDGIIYYGCANIAKRSYLLFTLTPDDYMYEVVNF